MSESLGFTNVNKSRQGGQVGLCKVSWTLPCVGRVEEIKYMIIHKIINKWTLVAKRVDI